MSVRTVFGVAGCANANRRPLIMYPEAMDVSNTESLHRPAKDKSRQMKHLSALILVPRRGLEPPRSYPLVPETSASTNSATWAGTVRSSEINS